MGLFDKWFRQKTEQPQALANRLIDEGNLLEADGDMDAALLRYTQAREIAPDMARPHMNVGNVRLARGDAAGALEAYDAALRAEPSHHGAHFNRGNALAALGQTESALAAWARVLKLRPDFSDAHVAMGALLEDVGRVQDAVVAYRAALTLRPDYAPVWSNLGDALFQLRQVQEAIECHTKAIALEPELATAHVSLGNALKDVGRLSDAEQAYRHACRLAPHEEAYRTHLLFCLAYRQAMPPLDLRKEAEIFGELASRNHEHYVSWPGSRSPGRPLKIGFMSGDLRQHPVGYFLEAVLSQLVGQPSRSMQWVAYSTMPVVMSDALTERLRDCVDQWHDVTGVSDADVAALIHDRDQIDILIDLSGHTSYTRLPVFAAQPSPVQVSWLGYFATTGVREMNWFLADPVTLPPEFEPHFTEQVWRLPHTRLCFSPPQHSPPVAPLPALAKGHVTFGCFNHFAKMSDDVVALWSRVLREVPDSRLLLKSPPLENEAVRQSVHARFAVHGIEPERIEMDGLSSRYDYLSTYGRIDIALDPFPYPGGTTSAESLWMGVPVLTLAGQSFLARQGAGLMVNAGLPDWVAHSEEEYLRIAVKKATNLSALAALRLHLRSQVETSPLMNAELFALHFSDALRGMWHRYCQQSEGPRDAGCA